MTPARRALLSAGAMVLILIGAGVAGFYRFLSKRPVAEPAEVVPPSWVEFRNSAGHEAHVGKASVACRECHDIDRAGFASPGAGICANCHQQQLAHTHTGGATKTDCLVCHTFAPAAAPTCIDCHRGTQGTQKAVVQHATTDCKNCHQPHEEPAISPRDCESCHEQRADHHAAHAGSKRCLDCHRAHEPGVVAMNTCSTCHQQVATTALAVHDACTTCHKPHQFAAVACAGCHGQKPTLVAMSVDAHGRCTSCHAPHAPNQAERACQRCHSEVEVSHGSKEDCASCHQPHGGDTHVAAAPCTGCHQAIASTDQGAHAGNQACTNCHKPHAFPTPPRGELCANCHAREVRLTTPAPMRKGHQECAACHGANAHRPAPAPACDKCHALEAASAPLGHKKCESCHEPHSGGKLHETCTACHENKANVLHATIRGGCKNCHRAHGPTGIAVAPACVSCHAFAGLPALHVVAQHRECAKCHTAHTAPRAERKTCTAGCHADRKNHQPTAVLCTGCHVFRD